MIVHVLRRAEAAARRPGRGRDRFARDRSGRAKGRRARGHDPRRPCLRLRPHLRSARQGRSGRPRGDRRQRAGRSADARRRPTSPRRWRCSPTRPSISPRWRPKSPAPRSATIPAWSRWSARRSAPSRLRALYFTRATAPYGEGPLYHHIGLYAFRRAALERFVALPPSPLEKREKLEQLRALEAGMRIDVAIVDSRAARRRYAGGFGNARAPCYRSRS